MVEKVRKILGTSVPGWSPELGSRLATIYGRLGGLTEASRLCGVSDETLAKYRDGGSRAAFAPLAQLAAEAKVSLDWLAYGQRQVPVIGLAECGLRGWYQEARIGLSALPPPVLAGIDDGDLVAVIAVGDSMVPAGISPGDICYCKAGSPRQGDTVLIELTDGHLAIKSWGETQGDWVTVQGWLPAEDGLQLPYTDRRRVDQVRRVRIVATVDHGLAPVLTATAGAPAVAGDDPHQRLYGIAIETTLKWLDEADLTLDPHKVSGLIAAAVGALSEYGAGGKTDADLEAEVRRSLAVARGMLTALGWKPR